MGGKPPPDARGPDSLASTGGRSSVPRDRTPAPGPRSRGRLGDAEYPCPASTLAPARSLPSRRRSRQGPARVRQAGSVTPARFCAGAGPRRVLGRPASQGWAATRHGYGGGTRRRRRLPVGVPATPGPASARWRLPQSAAAIVSVTDRRSSARPAGALASLACRHAMTRPRRRALVRATAPVPPPAQSPTHTAPSSPSTRDG